MYEEERAIILERSFMESHVDDMTVKCCFEYEVKERKGDLSPIYVPTPRYASAKIANDVMIWRTKQAEEIAS